MRVLALRQLVRVLCSVLWRMRAKRGETLLSPIGVSAKDLFISYCPFDGHLSSVTIFITSISA
jgi:hypothetical protein